MTAEHLEYRCPEFATICFWYGHLPSEIFGYPYDVEAFKGKLQILALVVSHMQAASVTRDNGAT